MPSFHYKALTRTGDIVSGSIAAPNASEVAHRIEYLGLIPIETVGEEKTKQGSSASFGFLSRPRYEDITFFTSDLALLLRTGARINEALELEQGDADLGRMRPVIEKITAAVLTGESFADALAPHPSLFPPMYVALVRVGEASGTLAHVLEVLAAERVRTETLRRRISDALRYPAFVLCAATAVLLFFLIFVLPQFATVLRDFNAKLDPIVLGFLAASDFLRTQTDLLLGGLVALLGAGFLVFRRKGVLNGILEALGYLPFIDRILSFHKTALFCRNLGVLLGSGVPLTMTLRILADMMASTGRTQAWTKTVDLVRRGGKLSDALAETKAIPALAVRTLRLGEESGQLPQLAEQIAEFYEAKLQRLLDRLVAIVGPAAIVTISIIVGGLIVSVMTALMSVSQVVG
jgi:general secretion pathway protein F